MRLMRLTGTGAGTVLTEQNEPQPAPGPGEVLVRVHAAGVIPTELQWYPTSHTKTGEPRSHAVPSHEFSGVVAALGEGTPGFKVGDEVYGMNDWFSDGALAEYCTAPASTIALKPARLTHAEAASVPISALTAWQGLFERAKLQAGERVLVQGGAGAVGLYAVQLAKGHGAFVIATASARNLNVVSNLGADHVIDYKAARFEESARDIDLVFDTVGGETLRRSWSVLKPGGRLVAIAADSENTTDEREKAAFFIVEPNHEQLVEIGNLLQSGQLQPAVDAVVPFAQASDAYTNRVTQRLSHGKMVIAIAES